MKYEGYELRWSKQAPMSIEIGVGDNKGALPLALKQLFTSRTIAIQHINAYLATKKTKEDVDAQAIPESRGK